MIRQRLPASWRSMTFAVVLCLGGCPQIEEGYFACNANEECPTDWFCRGDCRCYETPDETDASASSMCVSDGGD